MRDRVFLSITAGPSPYKARPVVATEDPSVIRAALEAIESRLGCGGSHDDGVHKVLRACGTPALRATESP